MPVNRAHVHRDAVPPFGYQARKTLNPINWYPLPQESHAGRRKGLGAWCQAEAGWGLGLSPVKRSHPILTTCLQNTYQESGARVMVMDRTSLQPGLLTHVCLLPPI